MEKFNSQKYRKFGEIPEKNWREKIVEIAEFCDENLGEFFLSIAIILFFDDEKFFGFSMFFAFFSSGILAEKLAQKFKKEIFPIFIILSFCSIFTENINFKIFANSAFIGVYLKKFSRFCAEKIKKILI